MERCRGFTLIELLVVIAVIAVLMAILMPVLRKAREQAMTIRCLANVKNWETVFELYVNGNGGKFFSGMTRQGYRWPLQLPDKQWDWTENEIWFCPTAPKHKLRKDENGIDVPRADLTFFHAWGIRPGGIAGSYGLNGYLLRIEDDKHDSLVSKDDGWPEFHNIKNPYSVPTLVDALHPQLWPMAEHNPAENEADAWLTPEGFPGMRKACIDRHNGFVSAAFADSSVRKVGLKELWTLKWYKKFDIGGPWTLAGGVQSETWPKWIRRYPDY